MCAIPHFDALTLSPDFRFIRIVSEEGVFYDVVRKWRSREHCYRMKQCYLDAKTVNRTQVPPCIFRDFSELDGPDRYRDCVWRNGTQRYFPLNPSDQVHIKP